MIQRKTHPHRAAYLVTAILVLIYLVSVLAEKEQEALPLEVQKAKTALGNALQICEACFYALFACGVQVASIKSGMPVKMAGENRTPECKDQNYYCGMLSEAQWKHCDIMMEAAPNYAEYYVEPFNP